VTSSEPIKTAYAPDTTMGDIRKQFMTHALCDTDQQLSKLAYFPSDDAKTDQQTEIKDVVFVIHGIRDVGHWTQKIARAVIKRNNKSKKGVAMKSETSSYGFFPMLPFILPWKRRQKVEWFMDQYAQALAEYPEADISFVGHSNGTYLLARALQDYPFCKFKNVVLAGSVVRSDYDWAKVKSRGQVTNVLNFVATFDWVVAFFPKAIEMFKIQDLGSAGHDGFDAPINQIKYVKGKHSAALDEKHWDAIAEFVVTGEKPNVVEDKLAQRQNKIFAFLAMIAPILWVIGLIGLFSIGHWLSGATKSETINTLMVLGFCWMIWTVITRL
jgi:pimeloyl-ACP methyl ester carboxylesterase